MPEIKDLYKQGPEKMWDYRFTLKQLQANDIYGLCLSFSSEILKLIPNSKKDADEKLIAFFDS